jgi:hypothetical protein
MTEETPAAVDTRKRGLLLHRLEKMRQRMLWSGRARLDAMFGRASLTEVKEFDLSSLDARELHGGISLSTAVAQH